MKIRSELNALASDIRSAAKYWDGGERIKIGQTDTTVAQVAQNVLDQLSKYQIEEKSLKGRIETSQNILNALDELWNKSPDPKKENDLLSAVDKVNQIVSSIENEQKNLENQVSQDIQKKLTDKFTAYPNSLEAQIIFAAFRTIKDVQPSEEWFMNGLGSWQRYSFLGLKQNLEQFLAFYKASLTEAQKQRINEVIPLLKAGGEMHEKIHNLSNLYQSRGASNKYLESQIVDLAYDIEKSIDQLGLRQSILIPGGCKEHAILYQIQRVRENEFQFSIYNTGFGNQFGQLFFDDIASDQFRVPLFVNLSKEAVSDQNFLIDLILYKMSSSRMSDIHAIILNHLKEKHGAEQTVREPHNTQTWGTCSYDSVASFLEYAFPPPLFNAFEYDMMLRARGILNDLLPRGVDIFPKNTLDFIDKKSCKTIADRKTKFDNYCDPFQHGDLTIANIVNIKDMKDQDDLKRLLEIWADHDIADEKKLGFFDNIVAITAHNGDLYAGSVINERSLLNTLYNILKPSNLVSGAFVYLKALDGGEEPASFSARRQVLRRFQSILEQEAPESAKILQDRNQELGRGKQPVLGEEIDLRGVFNYLKIRSEEIAMCVAPLLNSTFYPLSDASIGCANLPTSWRSNWQSNKVSAF